MRREGIAVYRLHPTPESGRKPEWRWHWKAANGRVVAASTEGYRSRADCISNLEKVTGGSVEISYELRTADGWYCQGQLVQQHVDTFLHVSP